jgi:hypothetical protein
MGTMIIIRTSSARYAYPIVINAMINLVALSASEAELIHQCVVVHRDFMIMVNNSHV